MRQLVFEASKEPLELPFIQPKLSKSRFLLSRSLNHIPIATGIPFIGLAPKVPQTTQGSFACQSKCRSPLRNTLQYKFTKPFKVSFVTKENSFKSTVGRELEDFKIFFEHYPTEIRHVRSQNLYD